MEPVEFAFWLSVAVTGYTYLGYPLLTAIIYFFKKYFLDGKFTSEENKVTVQPPLQMLLIFRKGRSAARLSAAPRALSGRPAATARVAEQLQNKFTPEVTILIAAYNEAEVIGAKVRNCVELDYPSEKLHVWVVTDGSTDESPGIAAALARQAGQGPEIRHYHQKERKGKMAALDRLMPSVESPLTIFTDANTLLNPGAVKAMVRHFQDPETGVVAGEKRVVSRRADAAAGSGEGLYWKYESLLKTWESSLHSTMGAAGELFAIRTGLYEQLPHDTLTEDFVLSMKVAMRGYRIAYEPGACATEAASLNTSEELKRKVRIAAGGLQSMVRLPGLLNPFRFGLLSFQYFSHRVLRWTAAPASLPLAFALNTALALEPEFLYRFLLLCQIIFYTFAITGHLLRDKPLKMKIFFVPYYFCMMNSAMFLGLLRLLKGRQSVAWEKARRAA